MPQFPLLGAAPSPLPLSRGHRGSRGLQLGRQDPGGREECEGLPRLWGVPGDPAVPHGVTRGPAAKEGAKQPFTYRGSSWAGETVVATSTLGRDGGRSHGGHRGGTGDPLLQAAPCHRAATGDPHLPQRRRGRDVLSLRAAHGDPGGEHGGRSGSVLSGPGLGRGVGNTHHPPPCLSFPLSQPKDSPWGQGSRSRQVSRIRPAGKGKG